MQTKTIFKKIFLILVYIFAAIGFVLVAGYAALELGWTNTKGIIDNQQQGFEKLGETAAATSTLPWNKGEEWQNFSNAIEKDQPVLEKVEAETGVPARLVVSVVAVEQLRLYYSERQTFKDLFQPLKILGTQTQFSWGIAGIKEATAIQIENNLKDATSTYYLGPAYAHLLDFSATSTNVSEERFARLTNYSDRTYQYLYTALYLKELATGWKNAGYDISNRPEILATLFNIGFDNSKPNANPQMGGAAITIDNETYSFGRLAGEIYYSNELEDYFPEEKLVI